MTKPKKKLVASFKGSTAQAFATDRVEITGKYRDGVYELFMSIQEENR